MPVAWKLMAALLLSNTGVIVVSHTGAAVTI